MHTHIIYPSSMTPCIHVWGEAAGWWEGLTAPAELPAALCTWISLPRKSAQESRLALSQSGQPLRWQVDLFHTIQMTCFFLFPLTNAPSIIHSSSSGLCFSIRRWWKRRDFITGSVGKRLHQICCIYVGQVYCSTCSIFSTHSISYSQSQHL